MDEPAVNFKQEGKVSLAPGGHNDEEAQLGFGNVSLSGGSPAGAAAREPPAADAPLFGGIPPRATMVPMTPVTAGTSFPSHEGGGSGGDGGQAGHGGRSSVLSQEAVQEVATHVMSNAGRALRRGASEIRVYVQANPYSITLMSFFGGLWLIIASVVTMLDLGSLIRNALQWILQGYQVFFGLIIVIIDGPPDRTCLPGFVRQKMLSYASFMHNNKTRFIFYLFIACQQGSQNNWPSKVTGWYFAVVAAGFALVQLSSPPAPPAQPVVVLPGEGGHAGN